MKPFDVGALLTEANRRTGLTDLGDPDCIGNLEAFVQSVNQSGEVAENRWDAAYEYVVRLLVNRQYFAKDLKDHPEILDEPLQPPVAIVALPRTGSTKLQRLLGATGHFQNLLWWQQHMFARIPGEADGGVAQRLEETKRFEKWCYEVCPDMLKGHPRFAEEPEEEQILNEYMFPPVMSVQFSGADYSQERLMSLDIKPVYQYMKMQLQYLQWQFQPGSQKPWLLKSPTNLGFEDMLVDTFGDGTKLICSHRNPVNIVCSIAKTTEYYRQVFSDVMSEEKTHRLGENMLAALAYAVQRHMEWRDANQTVQVLDIGFSTINRDSMKTVELVNDFLNLGMSKAQEEEIVRWDEEQKASHQRNDYSPEYFGLSESKIEDAFTPYLERYAELLKI